ncbi:TATA element modulatory factor [Hyphodiscus hymeniophilus]|uniref:TATA element modulatory factor n=1 Tax=Hyphodiscus hymeniophilus TaxID=353542 RepID=A0A9P7AY31_9HELO|nr:TATA element modulatory factor [Hyphodiscus hymeniophilus]
MSAPGKQSSSRWGFLQQAVAGVEARLDTILAEGAEEPTKKPPGSLAAATKTDTNISRSSSTSRTNDRLQERLARAVAAKNAAQKADSLSPSNTPLRTGSPATVSESPRQSIDVPNTSIGEMIEEEGTARSEITIHEPLENGDQPIIEVQADAAPNEPSVQEQQDINGLAAKTEDAVPRISIESNRSSIPRDSIDSSRRQSTGARPSLDVTSSETADIGLSLKTPAEYDALLKQLQSDYETSELQRQEETHSYIERIDALQAKLQYLAKESAEAARKASGSATAGSLEKKLAAKDEQVALLMEEGRQLSKKELNHLATIKKLRAKIQDDSKEVAEAQRKLETTEREAMVAMDRLRRSEGSDKRLNEKQKQIDQLQRDVESLKSDRDSKDSTINDLRKQLEQAAAQEKQAEIQMTNEALQKERRRVAELEDDVANLKIEKNLASDRAQAHMKEMREKMDKDAERARMSELEMKTEQHELESKLEVMRARAEEVSSGATGDAQAKLYRQIETLQTQYAIASENWQGIEASLVARAANLEKERDEATRREADIRKKAREVTLKAKGREDELEETRAKLSTFQQELTEHKTQLENLQKRAEEAESALVQARTTFDQEKQTWQLEILQRLDEEKQRWQEELAQSSLGHVRAESPAPSSRRGLTSEFLGLQNLQIRRASARSTTSEAPLTASSYFGRRPSMQPLRSGNGTPTRQDSMLSFGEGHEAPSIHADHDDFFENVATPSSPHQTLNDMVSVSTAEAGPSVQLIKRMSSAVRRLESEKVAMKEELAKLSTQRDEARAKIVAQTTAETRVVELEAEVAEIKVRYETTLEMLGEKSEQVEELRSDIDDIKTMYRDLIESTVK